MTMQFATLAKRLQQRDRGPGDRPPVLFAAQSFVMTLDARLLEILVCPNCRGDLEPLDDATVLACRGECGYRYPVRDGIPVLLVDEAEKPSR